MSNEIPLIQEGLDVRKRRRKAEPKARRKTRLQLLSCLKSGQATPRQEVARLLAVHRHPVSRWLETSATAGLAELRTLKTPPTRPPALPRHVKQALAQQWARPAGFRPSLEAQAWIQER